MGQKRSDFASVVYLESGELTMKIKAKPLVKEVQYNDAYF